ncbi:hypothetical protein [Thermus sp. NEB1569]|uniref:hypothetical protein n=1 Tax=Thermus sp. NEB1569 TaxID=2918899 RepID=UPI001EFBCBC1|nr:hypothetical protein [Thermus sp. NEB1569]ULR39700.1 hypothetical protein MI302_00395 [Thermus sp. NEB1569]
MRIEKLVIAVRELSYPGHLNPGLCDVDIYALPTGEALVILRDQGNHQGPSVINAIEQVASLVKERFLTPLGVHGPITWLEWSRSAIVSWAPISEVVWGDPVKLLYPQWHDPAPGALQTLLGRFGALEDFRRWMKEGTIHPSNAKGI